MTISCLIFVANYRSLELVIQCVLYIFHEPEISDAVNPVVAFENLSELQEAVDKTKHGADTARDLRDWLPFERFSTIYHKLDERVNTVSIAGTGPINKPKDKHTIITLCVLSIMQSAVRFCVSDL